MFGAVKHMLGMAVNYDMEKKFLELNQTTYIQNLIKKFNQYDSKEVSTPMEVSLVLTKEDEAKTPEELNLMNTRPYRSLVGALNYLCGTTRPDICVAVTKLSRFS